MKIIYDELFRFVLVGIAGFIVDASILSLMLLVGTDFFLGRGFSYLAAATTTWFLNRHWTFDNKSGRRLAQWARFLASNSLGATINYGVYAFLILHFNGSSYFAFPVLAVAAGSISGLALNFLLSKYVVFQNPIDMTH